MNSKPKRHTIEYNPRVLDMFMVLISLCIAAFIHFDVKGLSINLSKLFPTGLSIMVVYVINFYYFIEYKTTQVTKRKSLQEVFKACIFSFLLLAGLILVLNQTSFSHFVENLTLGILFSQFAIGFLFLISYRVMLAVTNVVESPLETTLKNFQKNRAFATKENIGENWLQNKATGDLLDRVAEFIPSSDSINKQIHGEVIFISGGAGSIGSEIARQVRHFQPKQVIVLDQGETAIHALELENLALDINKVDYQLIVGNIMDTDRIEDIFREYKPTIIFHAAAYKHVPLMESNPQEAFNINVLGTKCLADLSIKYQAKKFVMISTDKAINPTNIMGATKRLAEIYVQGLNRDGLGTQFITTRFGNVLGSNGSVIPLFNKQIEAGGPVTITHKDIRRYFMTIQEACNLVLEAAAMGTGGEIFVFDMGASIKIYDLALRLIRLHGKREYEDIDIEVTGLRPGEKLYEEPWANEETTIPTAHPKIKKAYVREEKFEMIANQLSLVKGKISTFTKKEVFLLLADLVPEFRTNNEDFLKFDRSPPPWDEINSP